MSLRLVVDNTPKRILAEDMMVKAWQIQVNNWAFWIRFWQGRS